MSQIGAQTTPVGVLATVPGSLCVTVCGSPRPQTSHHLWALLVPFQSGCWDMVLEFPFTVIRGPAFVPPALSSFSGFHASLFPDTFLIWVAFLVYTFP